MLQPSLHGPHLHAYWPLGVGDPRAWECLLQTINGGHVVCAQIYENRCRHGDSLQSGHGSSVDLPCLVRSESQFVGFDKGCGIDEAVLCRQDLDLQPRRPASFGQDLPQHTVVDAVIDMEGWGGRSDFLLTLRACKDKQMAGRPDIVPFRLLLVCSPSSTPISLPNMRLRSSGFRRHLPAPSSRLDGRA